MQDHLAYSIMQDTMMNPTRHEDTSPSYVNDYLSEEIPKRYSSIDLKSFTSDFSECIGHGGFAEVYKGVFPCGELIAVKVLNKSDFVEDTFMAEVRTMRKTAHRNLVKFYGYCFEDNTKALVYEYMENGSLDKILYEKKHHGTIEWVKLYAIVIDIANGLHYLHHGIEEHIIHHDIKAANILLDKKFSAKIADFGLARIMDKDVSRVDLSGIRGTQGYNAPETWMPGSQVTFKCDVYSFGMMLFEVVGKRENGRVEKWFPGLVWSQFENGNLEHYITTDCGIEEKDKENANILCKVAFWCVQDDPNLRPSMTDVVLMLKKEKLVKDPPFPSYVFRPFSQMIDMGESGRENIGRERSDKMELDRTYPQNITTCPTNESVAGSDGGVALPQLKSNNCKTRSPNMLEWSDKMELDPTYPQNIIAGPSHASVADPKPIQSLEIVCDGDFDAFASREYTTKKIIEALKDGEIGLIGVFGMAGVGKTMLLEVLSKKVKEERMFDEVVMVTVSQNPDLEKIQDNIAKGLDLGFGERDNSFTRKAKLYKKINQGKKTLVVLDDLWERLEIAKVGIPHKNVNKDCKVVFTTRDQGVCGRMESDKIIEVKILTAEDSWQLFQKRAGDDPHNSILPEVAKDIAKECKGLPLAIATLGRALRGKDEKFWENALRLLRKSIFASLSPVVSSIKMSYDFLGREDMKMCFLFCCLYPEDYKIDTDIIFFHVMGEKLLRNADTFIEARSMFYLMVDELVCSCLLLRDEEGYVMLHDVVRDVAISIASEESNRFIVRAGMNLTQWPNVEVGNCNRLSLMSNKITCFLRYQIEAPYLLTLCLNENSSIEEIPSDFFEGMQNLTTLDLSHISIQSLPQSFSCLKSLRVLCMDYCSCLFDISQIEWLKSLEILSLRECRRIESWESLGKLTTLKMLDLSLIQDPEMASFPAKVISNLHELEDLRIIGRIIIKGDDVNQSDDDVGLFERDQSYENVSQSDEDVGQSDEDQSDEDVGQSDEDQSDEDVSQSDEELFERDVGLSEIACLTRLTCLHMTLMNNECNSQVVPTYWQNLTDFIFEFVFVSGSFYSITREVFLGNCKEFKKNMYLQLSSISVPNWILMLSGLTNCLYLRDSKHLKSVEQLDPSHSFDKLKLLSIEFCDSMTHLYSTASCEAKAPMYAFRNLETLKLNGVDELVAFCDGTLPQGFFQNLKSLMVRGCPEVIILIPCDLLERLQNLEILNVRFAKNMEKLVQLEKSTTNATQSMSSSGPSFPIFPKLRILHISGCDNLKYLLPMRVLRELRQLEILDVSISESMVMIVEPENYEDEGIDVDQDKAILPRLKRLELFNLPELMSFCPSRLCFDWPALEYLRVDDCPMLKRLPLHTNSAPKLRTLDVEQQLFDGLEWEDESLKSRLQPLLLD